MTHYLKIYDCGDPDDPESANWDVIHPPDCRQERVDIGGGLSYMEYTCEVGTLLTTIGLDLGQVPVEVGTYVIEPWSSSYHTSLGVEHNVGLSIVGRAE